MDLQSLGDGEMLETQKPNEKLDVPWVAGGGLGVGFFLEE